MSLEWLLIDVLIAFVLDLMFGDPNWLPHPVRFIGGLIQRTEKILRSGMMNESDPRRKKRREKFSGVLLALFVVSFVWIFVFLITAVAHLVHPLVFHGINIYILYTSLAAKCLASEANKVKKALLTGTLKEARIQLSMLVGRETAQLSEKDIIRGTVETTAENTSDGVVSPLFYAVLGSFFGIGAPLVYAFKAISTLDSMVGYMNEKYQFFGWASAKLDDIANYIPARITGLLIPIGSIFLGLNGKRSFSIMLRDRRNHKSPNCAYPEAAVAGALGIRIGGNNVYFGKVVEKPTIGDPVKELEISDIENTNRLMYAAAILALFLFAGIPYVIIRGL